MDTLVSSIAGRLGIVYLAPMEIDEESSSCIVYRILLTSAKAL